MGRDLRGFEFIKDEKVNICMYVCYVCKSSLDRITLATTYYKPAAQSDIINS